jgi:hypothetical protein
MLKEGVVLMLVMMMVCRSKIVVNNDLAENYLKKYIPKISLFAQKVLCLRRV